MIFGHPNRRAGLAAFLWLLASFAAAAEKASLVVVISVDQMRADYLERFRPWFGSDGFNRFLDRGAVFREARHRHATTFTGPGHASIGTGLDPSDHGIVGNIWYDVRHRDSVYCVEDPRTDWVGLPPNSPRVSVLPASPVHLDGDSLGDRLKEKFPGARVVGLALKDRAAVLMAGRKADAALWFPEKIDRFVTSTYYPRAPELLGFNERVPAFLADPEHRTWTLSDAIPPADLERVTFDPPELYGSKDPPSGYGPTFPHALSDAKAIMSSPWGPVLLLDLARFTIERMRLGATEGRPDLLFIGISSTDYYGHWFGPDSKEVADGIVRLDRTLESFFRWLDEKVGRERVLLFLTADHGVQSIPQVARARSRAHGGADDPSAAGRIDLDNGPGPSARVSELPPDRVRLENELAKRHGYALDADAANRNEGIVEFFEEPCLYLNRQTVVRRGLDPEKIKAEIRDWVAGRPGVLATYTNTQIEDGLPESAPHAVAVRRAFRADRSGDVFVILKPGWMWSYGKDRGTTHGQPNDDDARVPLLAWGPGVRKGTYDARVSPISIAKTVAAIYGFQAGEADAEILEPVRGRPMEAAAAVPR